jgi:hypothetical protein
MKNRLSRTADGSILGPRRQDTFIEPRPSGAGHLRGDLLLHLSVTELRKLMLAGDLSFIFGDDGNFIE